MAYGWIQRGAGAAIPAGAHVVAVEIEITMLDDAPQPILFAALQTNFESERGEQFGANHVGLQWNSLSPCARAVNFGGYVDPAGVRAGVPHEVSGRHHLETGEYLSPAAFPLMPNGDRRTAQYAWHPGIAVHLAVHHLGGGTWRATIDGLPFRDSFFPGTDRIGSMVFWTEYGSAPCRCRFANLVAYDRDGTRYPVGAGVRIDASRPGQRRAYFDDHGLVFEPPVDDIVIPDREVVTLPVARR
jgi:hypothetical protein